MKKLLSLFATVLIAVGVNAQKVVSEIDWTQEKFYPAGWIYSEGATVSVTSEGLTIEANPKENANYWEPQIPIIKGFNLEKGGLYQVKITINSPVAGELRLDLGSWDGSGASQAAAINVTKGVKEYTALFLDYPTGCSDAQVLYQCGKLPGKHVIKEVKVIDLNKAPLEGDLNHDGEVNAADVVCLVDIIMKKESHSQPTGSYWYYGKFEDLENGSYPSEGNIVTYTNDMYQTFDATGSSWYNLDTSIERIHVPFAPLFLEYDICCVAVPVSSGFNDILDLTNTSMIGISITQSNKTINGIEYIVWIARGIGRLMGYLIKK
jgi:hypothetical protein